MTQWIGGLLTFFSIASALAALPEVCMLLATFTLIWCVMLDAPFER